MELQATAKNTQIAPKEWRVDEGSENTKEGLLCSQSTVAVLYPMT